MRPASVMVLGPRWPQIDLARRGLAPRPAERGGGSERAPAAAMRRVRSVALGRSTAILRRLGAHHDRHQRTVACPLEGTTTEPSLAVATPAFACLLEVLPPNDRQGGVWLHIGCLAAQRQGTYLVAVRRVAAMAGRAARPHGPGLPDLERFHRGGFRRAGARPRGWRGGSRAGGPGTSRVSGCSALTTTV